MSGARSILKPSSSWELSVQERSIRFEEAALAESAAGEKGAQEITRQCRKSAERNQPPVSPSGGEDGPGIPQATLLPSFFRAALKRLPAPTSMTLASPAGTLVWP